jgi:YegS/Rv2252/BmrU family lipid kinase
VTTLLLVNPMAGHGRARRLAVAAESAARRVFAPVERVDTTAPGAAVEIVRQSVEQGASRILVLGGDGTVHEAANGLLRADAAERPPLAIIPAGTGNDFAKLCGTARLTPEVAVERLARGRIGRLDVGEGWGEYFLNSIGVGFDAEVAHRLTLIKHGRGLPAYLLAVFRTLADRETFEVEVQAGAHGFRDRLLLLEVGNGPVVGGGFRITPLARPDDGQLDICAIQDMPLPMILLRLPLVMLGRHLGLRQVRHFRCEHLVIRSVDGPLRAQFDGEIRSQPGPLEIRVHPGALPVLLAQ